MSRYTLLDSGTFGSVVVGWDPPPAASFFLQCFAQTEDDDEPVFWKPRIGLPELERVLNRLNIPLPSLLLRVLMAEARDTPFRPAVGDPVFWRRLSPLPSIEARVVELVEGADGTRVLLEHTGGRTWAADTEVEADLLSVGVE